MNGPIRVVVVSDGSVDPRALQAAVAGNQSLQLVDVIGHPGDWTSHSEHDHDALVIASDGTDQGGVVGLVARAVSEAARPVIVMSTLSANGLVGQVLEAGAADIVVVPEPSRMAGELTFALQKAVVRKVAAPAAQDSAGAQFICILGPKGGIGKTLTSSNLAVGMAMAGKRSIVIDLDLQFGDVGLVMGVQPTKTLFDLATSGGTLDAQKVDAFSVKHPSGARALLAPVRPDQGSAVTPDFLREVYDILRDSVDVIIIDTPPGMTPEVIGAIDASTHVCLVGTLDAASLKNAKLGLETLELMNYPLERVRMVLNRADSDVGISHQDVASVLGRTADVLVPSNRDVVRSVNSGEPIVMSKPRTDAGKAFKGLTDLFIAEAEAAAGNNTNKGRRRLFGRG